MTIRLIACDMDDTLLNSNGRISQRNVNAIKKAIASGVVFLLATGRMYISVRPYALNLGLDVPLISYNGALVKGSKSGKVYYEHKMTLKTAQEVLKYCQEENLYLQLYIKDKILIKEENEYSRMYSRISGIPTTAIGNKVFSTEEEPYKILVMTDSDAFDVTWENIAEHFQSKLDVTSSKENFLELMEPGVNKWAAVKSAAATFGIAVKEIMCIGDSNNDISMIANAGIGVAVANAKDNVKKYAKIITASNDDDGVALAIDVILTPQAKEGSY